MTILDRLLGRTGSDVFEQQELVKRVIGLLEGGMSPGEVEDDLARHGTPRRQARRTIRHVRETRRRGLHLFDRS